MQEDDLLEDEGGFGDSLSIGGSAYYGSSFDDGGSYPIAFPAYNSISFDDAFGGSYPVAAPMPSMSAPPLPPLPLPKMQVVRSKKMSYGNRAPSSDEYSKGMEEYSAVIEKESEPEPEPIPEAETLSVEAIARKQTFDGAFKQTPDALQLLLQGKPIPPIPESLANRSTSEKESIWLTVLALAVLEKSFSSDEERAAWEIIAEKAADFVKAALEEDGLSASDAETLFKSLKAEANSVV